MRRLGRILVTCAVLVGSVTTAAGHQGPGSASTSAGSPRAPRFRSPLKPGLPALGTQALVKLGGTPHVDARQYADLSAAVQTLLAQYPADRHYFIGLGRDPAPIVAFLQNLGGRELAINFPASSNGSGSATRVALGTYVKKLVPPDVLESGRTIVFVDVTTSGRALDHYVPLISPSLGPQAKVLKVAFGVQHNGSRNYAIFTKPGDKHVIETAAFPEVNKFFVSPYEGVVSEYPRHVPGKESITFIETPRAEYQQYRDALLQRMQRDEGLHQFLTTRGGPAFQGGDPQAPP